MIRRKLMLAATMLLLTPILFSAARAQVAEPTPDTPFGQIGCAGVVPAAQGMHKAIVEVEESLQKLTKKLSDESAPDGKEMAQYYMLVGKLNRWINFLDHYREPAVVDWRFRASYYHKALLEFRNRYYATKKAPIDRQNVIKKLTNDTKSREKALFGTLKQLQAGEAKKAENSIENIQKDVLSISGVLHDADKKPFYDDMLKVVQEVSVSMSSYRNRESEEAEQIEQTKQSDLLDQLEQALANGTGADGLAQATRLWRALHIQSLRVYAFSNTLRSSAIGMEYDSSLATGPGKNTKTTDETSAKIKAAILDYISRQANAVAPTQAAELHQDLLKVLAELSIRVDETSFDAAIEKRLGELAKKGQFSADLYNYQLATNELLRWRQRTAKDWADAKSASSVSSIAAREMASTDQYVGLYDRNPQSPLPVLLKAVPDLVPDVKAKLIGQLVRTPRILPVDNTEKASWFSQADNGFYFTIERNPIAKVVLPQLKKDLLCAEGGRPLTLVATAALLSAEVGVCEQSGGELNDFAIEGYVSRMTNIPEGQSSILPWGNFGPEPRGDAKRYLMIRCQMRPDWIHHRYHFVTNLK